MSFSFKVTTRTEPAGDSVSTAAAEQYPGLDEASFAPSPRRGVRLLAGLVLFAAVLVLLWMNVGFARYAFTGLFWRQTAGAVLSSSRESFAPTVEFFTPDGAAHTFSEDYITLCGRRSFCWRRDFTAGQAVPVVYDPAAPDRAYIRDWALYSNIITWFFELGIALLLALMLWFFVRPGRINLSVQLGAHDAAR